MALAAFSSVDSPRYPDGMVNVQQPSPVLCKECHGRESTARLRGCQHKEKVIRVVTVKFVAGIAVSCHYIISSLGFLRGDLKT